MGSRSSEWALFFFFFLHIDAIKHTQCYSGAASRRDLAQLIGAQMVVRSSNLEVFPSIQNRPMYNLNLPTSAPSLQVMHKQIFISVCHLNFFHLRQLFYKVCKSSVWYALCVRVSLTLEKAVVYNGRQGLLSLPLDCCFWLHSQKRRSNQNNAETGFQQFLLSSADWF